MSSSQQKDNVLPIPTTPTNEPCSECGDKNSPNLQYTLVGFNSILCRPCLDKEIENVNRILDVFNSEDGEI